MLIDAAHPEETRVVVLRGNKVEEFDFEAAERQQLRGNIYLAKVTRVEPSLQAAFVEYGGNRHGFLAFSEIHPDYYQIPYADRQALIEEQAREEAAEAAAEEPVAEEPEAAPAEEGAANGADEDIAGDVGSSAEIVSEANGAGAVEQVGAEDALEEVPQRPKARPRQYKIQEVIKRRQVLLVQVVKEERGTKGAALTTYLSLAGRYSVLMPNTARGGGISRKITTPLDRKRLKSIASELDVPGGMGVILRTAGANRTKSEIKRDFEYLLRLWENVRELTLRSTAPKLVYEEGSLIKRAIRDLYSREIEQIVVAGEPAYREAKDFMRMLMPSHARNVHLYRDDTPIFARSSVETQLDAMFSPQVTLRSGGYIVINQTEALVSIDVNSGRSTREHSIEDTALNTNMEASEEIARQLRLRDLAGLIVIDFIDMEEKRNNRSVERKLKDCLRADRARIQVGRISHFGLLEMSRQRIRTGVLESSVVPCPHCRGAGQVRSISSLSLQILRALEDYLLRHAGHHLLVRTRPEVALYVLNQKRVHLAQLEQRFGLTITISGEAPENGAGYTVERGMPVEDRPARVEQASPAPAMPEPIEDEPELEADEERTEEQADEGRDRRRRRRRRRGNGEDRHERGPVAAADRANVEDEDDASEVRQNDRGSYAESPDSEAGQEARRRRRGRRGGRRRSRGRENGDTEGGYAASSERSDQREGDASDEAQPGDAHAEEVEALTAAADRAPQDEFASGYSGDSISNEAAEPAVGAFDEDNSSEDAAVSVDAAATAERLDMPPEPALPESTPVEDNRPKRSGWWSKRSSFF
jgi:ribonuclease E